MTSDERRRQNQRAVGQNAGWPAEVIDALVELGDRHPGWGLTWERGEGKGGVYVAWPQEKGWRERLRATDAENLDEMIWRVAVQRATADVKVAASEATMLLAQITQKLTTAVDRVTALERQGFRRTD
jgi:hypothetical protein